MIKGIGCDLVYIPRIQKLLDENDTSFFKYTFTAYENNEAENRKDKATYYASRFAAKEALFKAIAHLLPTKSFDFRIVETRNEADGHPYIYINEEIRPVLQQAGITDLQLSLSDENDYALAFVVASFENHSI